MDWDLGRKAVPQEGRPALKPGLRACKKIRQARPGKDTSSLGRFIKLSEEYRFILPKVNLVPNGWLLEHGRICLK